VIYNEYMSSLLNRCRNRAIGCSVGAMVGDAFGGRYEFMDRISINEMLIEPNNRLINGGGAHGLHKGQITDDTELALALMYSLLTRNCDNRMLLLNYVEWFESNPIDIGNTTRNAFRGIRSQRLKNEKYYQFELNKNEENVRSLNSTSQSNGSLMRVYPIAIALTGCDDKKIERIVEMDCHLTHIDNSVIVSSIVFCIAISSLIHYGNKYRAYERALEYARTHDEYVYKILRMSKYDNDNFEDSDGTAIRPDGNKMGLFGIALQCAFYELLNGKNFSTSIIRIVSKGGDTDTNACISGALLGAYYGFSDLPDRWVDSVLYPEIHERLYKYPKGDQRKIISLTNKLFDKYVVPNMKF
jgi:ADP-ribosyl-[dinitrogen reductase] hydrolase